MYIDENGKSTTAIPIEADGAVQYQDTSQSYISIHDAVELVCKARRMKPLDGIIVDTMSWAISFVNSVPSVKFSSTDSSTDSSGDYVRRDDVLMCLTGEYDVDEKCDPVDLSTRFMKRIKSLPSVKFSSTDCISRQQALDASCLSEKTRRVGGDRSGYDTVMLYEIQDILEDLPSVKSIAENATTTEDCINREDILKWLDDNIDGSFLWGALRAHIAKMPSVTPERKKGKWIKKDCDLLYCSECDLPSLHPWPYCERCGTKMEVDNNDERASN